MPLHALTRWEFQQHKESHPWGSREPCGETTSKQGLLELKSGLCCRHRGNALAAEQTRTIGLGRLPWLRVWCFRPSKRPLSSSSGPQRGGTQEVAGSLQSPVCGDPEGISGCGQHWAPGSSVLLAPHPTFPPSSFFPSHERPEEAEAPKDRKGGGEQHMKRLWPWGATSLPAPPLPSQTGLPNGQVRT